MPRRGGGGRSSSSRPARYSPRPKPATRATAPAPAPASAGNVSRSGGFLSAIVDGIGWGAGTSIAHRAIDSIMGPRVIHHGNVTVNSSAPPQALAQSTDQNSNNDPCASQNKAFQECLNNSGSDISKCQFYMDMVAQCRGTSAASAKTSTSDAIFL